MYLVTLVKLSKCKIEALVGLRGANRDLLCSAIAFLVSIHNHSTIGQGAHILDRCPGASLTGLLDSLLKEVDANLCQIWISTIVKISLAVVTKDIRITMDFHALDGICKESGNRNILHFY